MSPYRENPPAPCDECAKRDRRSVTWKATKRVLQDAAFWAPVVAAITAAFFFIGYGLRECSAGRTPHQRHEACQAECMGSGHAFESYIAGRCFCGAGNDRVMEVTP